MLRRLCQLAGLGLAALVLSACAPALTPTPTATPLPPTATPVPPTPSRVPATATPVPDHTSVFPPVGPGEWQKGPADARLTIIEYSDYQ